MEVRTELDPLLSKLRLDLFPDLQKLLALLIGQRCHKVQAAYRFRVTQHGTVEGVGRQLSVGGPIGGAPTSVSHLT